MPQIPVLQSQVSPQAAPDFQQRPLQSTFGQDLGEGVSNAAGVVYKIQQQEKLKADRAAFMDADRTTDTVANDLLTQGRSKQLKDAIGVTPTLLADFDKQSRDVLGTLTTDRQRLAYQEAVNQRRSQLQRELDNHEGQQREAYYAKSNKDYQDQAQLDAITAYKDPKAIQASIAKIGSAIDQMPGLDSDMKATELSIRRAAVHTGVVQRYLANDDINGADRYYNSVRDQVGGEKATYIENAITDAKRIAEARALALANRRDAIAERAINEMDRQNASGIPATPAMQIDWQNKVRGTSFESDFKDRVADQQDIQALLRKPIDEQLTDVQQRQAALDSGGGSLREAANLQRLKGAVQQNLTALQKTPLIFAANRANLDVPPLDVGELANGDQTGGQASSLQARVDTIQGLRKQYGTQVGMNPLLPQEAAQLSSVVNSASPAQVSQLFGQIYNATGGNNEAYTGIMQQIAPDAPVRAFAGILASRQRTATVETHWFSPDVTVQSGDVAKTLLSGEAMLDPSKAAKGADGKPKVSLYLPETKTLQDEFQSQIGTAFAGRPDAAQLAFQAVQAYYVGKAAETGRIASGNTDIDTGIVKEAITATLGKVVDVNGRGEVLAPYGMDDAAFTQAARTALERQKASIHWPSNNPLSFDALGLKAAGQDSYFVTAGRGFLVDKGGDPVVLSLGAQPAPVRRTAPVRPTPSVSQDDLPAIDSSAPVRAPTLQ